MIDICLWIVFIFVYFITKDWNRFNLFLIKDRVLRIDGCSTSLICRMIINHIVGCAPKHELHMWKNFCLESEIGMALVTAIFILCRLFSSSFRIGDRSNDTYSGNVLVLFFLLKDIFYRYTFFFLSS